MKVLGKASRDTYLCEVSHEEIEKFLNLYYGHKPELKVGEVVDLGLGYNFASEIKDALKKTEEFVKSNQKTVQALLNGFSLVELRKIKPEKTEQTK